jgi:DNA-binding XRE family transcriptional regulator
MLEASVRTRDVHVEIFGVIPGELLEVLRREYQHRLLLRVLSLDPMRDVMQEPLYLREPLTPGPADNLRFYRGAKGITQAQLARVLGGIPRQNVSEMERGLRPIGKRMARKLAEVFGTSPVRFLDGGPPPTPLRGRPGPSPGPLRPSLPLQCG